MQIQSAFGAGLDAVVPPAAQFMARVSESLLIRGFIYIKDL